MTLNVRQLLVVLVALLALFGASCGDSDDDATATVADESESESDNPGTDDADDADEPSDNAAEGDSATDDEGEEPAEDGTADNSDSGDDDSGADDTGADDTGADVATAPEVDPADLTDSFRGVTAETIKVGFTAIDFQALRDLGIDISIADYQPFAQAFADDLNQRGGINGRQIELVIETFTPTGAATAEPACVKLTEDEEVFVVLNGFAGPGAEDVNTCFVDTHETILIGGTPNDAQLARAVAPWVTHDMSLSRRAVAFATLFDQAGMIGDLGKIMLLSSNPEFDSVTSQAGDALTAVGADVAFQATVTATGDQTGTEAEVGNFLERARAEGVTSVIQFGAGVFATDVILEAGDEFTMVLFNGDQASDFAPQNLDPGDTVLSSITLPDPEQEETKRCVALIEDALGLEVIPPTELATGETNNWAGTINVCRQFKIFEKVATAAGADLTNDSFTAALDAFGSDSLAEYPFTSLSSTKRDARDSLGVGQWDHDLNEWVEISDQIDVGSQN